MIKRGNKGSKTFFFSQDEFVQKILCWEITSREHSEDRMYCAYAKKDDCYVPLRMRHLPKKQKSNLC